MDKYEDLIEQYVEKFDEGFPTYHYTKYLAKNKAFFSIFNK